MTGTAEPVPRDQILRRERGQENIHFPGSSGQEQDWQPFPVDLYSAVSHDYGTVVYIFTHLYLCLVYSEVTFSCLYSNSTMNNLLVYFLGN